MNITLLLLVMINNEYHRNRHIHPKNRLNIKYVRSVQQVMPSIHREKEN